MFCRNELFRTFVRSAKFSQIIFYHCYPQSRKEKKSNLSQTSSASKKICLQLPNMESLAFRFNKGKQSKLEFKSCLKPLFVSSKVSQSTSSTVSLNSNCVKLNTLILPTYSSSTATSASLSSQKFSDAQAQFKQHMNAISGIHSEAMKNYSSFLNEMAGKVGSVNAQVVPTKEQTKKNNIILLQSLTFLKLLGE